MAVESEDVCPEMFQLMDGSWIPAVWQEWKGRHWRCSLCNSYVTADHLQGEKHVQKTQRGPLGWLAWYEKFHNIKVRQIKVSSAYGGPTSPERSNDANGGYAGGGAMGSEGPRSLALAAPSRGMSSKELGEELGEVSKKLGGATEKLGEVSEKLGEELGEVSEKLGGATEKLGEVSEKLGEELGEKLDRVTEKLSKLDEVTEKLGEVSCKLDGVTEKLTKLVGTMDTMARSDAAWWGVDGQDQQWWPPWEGEAQAAEAAEEGPPKTMKLQ